MVGRSCGFAHRCENRQHTFVLFLHTQSAGSGRDEPSQRPPAAATLSQRAQIARVTPQRFFARPSKFGAASKFRVNLETFEQNPRQFIIHGREVSPGPEMSAKEASPSDLIIPEGSIYHEGPLQVRSNHGFAGMRRWLSRWFV